MYKAALEEMSNKIIFFAFICLLFAIAVYQYQKRGSQRLSAEERTAIALRKVIENRTSSYRKVAVGYVSCLDCLNTVFNRY